MRISVRGPVFETNSSSTHAYLYINDLQVVTDPKKVQLIPKEQLTEEFEETIKRGDTIILQDKKLSLNGLSWFNVGWDGSSWQSRVEYILFGLFLMNFEHHKPRGNVTIHITTDFPEGTFELLRLIFSEIFVKHLGHEIHPSLGERLTEGLESDLETWGYMQTSEGLTDESSVLASRVFFLAQFPPEVLERIIFSDRDIKVEID